MEHPVRKTYIESKPKPIFRLCTEHLRFLSDPWSFKEVGHEKKSSYTVFKVKIVTNFWPSTSDFCIFGEN